MQPIDFTYVVLPLGTIIILLVALVLLSETRKERQEKKIKRAVEKLSKEKTAKEQTFKSEQAELDRLHQLKSIDKDTYDRLTTLMRMNEQQYEETMTALICAENILKKPKARPKHKMAISPQIGFS
jgi:biopolymer transport protein ExbB/TolQ